MTKRARRQPVSGVSRPALRRRVSSDPKDAPILEVYGENMLRYWLRAHPNVGAVWHADLVRE